MVVANHIVNAIAIYFGYGNGAFSDPVQYSTGIHSSPYIVTVADFNKDNQSEIVVANYDTNSINIFLSIGNGSFKKQVELSTGSSHPIWISVSDLNNDNIIDIVTANYGTHSISVFYGYSFPNFSIPRTYSTGYDSFPSSVAIGYLNNDNKLDIAVASYGTDSIKIFFGNENNTFENYQIMISLGISSHPYSISVGDFNADSFLDIVVANYGTRNLGVLLNNGNGSFAKQITYSTGFASPYCITVGDFNKDKHLDLAVTNNGATNIALLIGYGDGKFDDAMMYSSGSTSSISIAIGDLNNDQRLDMALVSNDTGTIDILLGTFEGFENQMRYSVGSWPTAINVGDLNNDDQLDIILANYLSNDISILLSNGDGSF